MIYAILAAIVWGFSYTLDEKLVEKIPISIIMLYESIIFVVLFSIYIFLSKQSFIDLELFSKDKTILMYFIFSTLLSLIGGVLIIASIKESNATVAGLIEISYPIFIIIASYLLFKTHHLNPYLIFGGFLIFSGVFLIYLKGNT